MRILHIYKDYDPVVGGIETHGELLAEGQAALGHDVTVLVTNDGPRTTVELRQSVRVIRAARLASVSSTPLSLSLPCRLSRERPDVTHLHFPYPVGEVSQYLVGQGCHTVMTYHSDVVRQKTLLWFYRPLMLRILRSIDCILVTSPNYLESSPVLQRVRERCRVAPFGIDRSRFLSVDEGAVQALRQRHGDGPIALFVGVLRYYKGVSYLLEAMPDVPAKLLVVGEGPMGQELRSRAQTLGLADKVAFLGRLPDDELLACYQAADLFVLPACERSEAFGLVQVEAMSCGLPVISTEIGTGTSYVNKHGESGLVVPPKDPRALARAMQTLLADDALRCRLGEGARARSQLFTAERMLDAVQEVYDDLCGQPGGK